MRVRVDTQDDLWTLYNIIEKGDFVYARTTRELKTSTGSRRKPMVLGVRVERLEFQPFTTRLRIHGVVIAHPKEHEVTGHHTLNIDLGSDLTIQKEHWPQHAIKRIEEACSRSRLPVVLVGIDDEDVAVAKLMDYGVQTLAEYRLSLPGKREADKRRDVLAKRMADLAKLVVEVAGREGAKYVVVAGPAFWKNYLVEAISKLPQSRDLKIVVEDASSGGVKGVREALKRGAFLKALRGYGVVEEGLLIDELLKTISKDERMAAYGLEQVGAAVEAGAVEKLFVLDTLLRSTDLEERRRVEELMRKAERLGAYVRIFSSVDDPGYQLKSLGGVAALLRYPLQKT